MIGIIYCNELNMCPYLNKYTDSLEENNIEYKVLLWNRTGDGKSYPDNYIIYRKESELYIPKWKKIGAFIGYTRFLYQEIKIQKFDKLIMLTTLPTVICSPMLLKRYRGKYIYDFRDMSFEKYVPFRKLVEKLVIESYFTCMSSPGYKTTVKGLTISSHNFRRSDLDNQTSEFKPIGDRIRLLHIGIARGEEYNKRLANLFGNDERFEIQIVGTGNDTKSFKEYIRSYHNITVSGTYNNDEKMRYINQCDALLYYYPCSYNNNRALANKYYDGMIYKKPLIGNINTYSGKRVEKNGLGISVDISDDNVPDLVYNYLSNIDVDSYMENVNRELQSVIKEDDEYLKKIDEFILS